LYNLSSGVHQPPDLLLQFTQWSWIIHLFFRSGNWIALTLYHSFFERPMLPIPYSALWPCSRWTHQQKHYHSLRSAIIELTSPYRRAITRSCLRLPKSPITRSKIPRNEDEIRPEWRTYENVQVGGRLPSSPQSNSALEIKSDLDVIAVLSFLDLPPSQNQPTDSKIPQLRPHFTLRSPPSPSHKTPLQAVPRKQMTAPLSRRRTRSRIISDFSKYIYYIRTIPVLTAANPQLALLPQYPRETRHSLPITSKKTRSQSLPHMSPQAYRKTWVG
jgi:hypothetical protein